MKVSKVVCTVGSGVGGTIGLGVATVSILSVLWGIGFLYELIFVKWVLLALISLLLVCGVGAAWWGLSTWLYGHCQDYWSNK